MTLIQEEPKHSLRVLLIVGIPAFVLAVLVSMMTHQYIHMFVNKVACTEATHKDGITAVFNMNEPHTTCPLSSAAGATWTFILAIASFASYMRFPRNLFLGALAFVNASIRLPETIAVFLQLLFTSRAKIMVDESRSLALLRLTDPTVSVILMCFCSLTILFLTITIIHDTKTIPWKWAVALGLFIILGPLENILWKIISPLYM